MNSLQVIFAIFIAVILSSLHSPNGEPIDVVNTLVTKFEALSAPRYDVLAKVKAISENSAAILEAGFPVASLALANLNIVNQAGSEEYRALMKLSDSMDWQFRQISRSSTYSYNVINLSLIWRRYTENVELWFPRHQREVTKMTNPRLDKTKRDVEEYVRMCRDYRLDPQMILDVGLGQNDNIGVLVTKGCPPAEDERDALLLAKINEILHKTKIIKHALFYLDEQRFRQIVLDIMKLLVDMDTTTVLDAFDQIYANKISSLRDGNGNVIYFTSSLDAITFLYNEMNSEYAPIQHFYEYEPDGCLLLDVINGKNFHREPIKHLADIVSNHVLLFEYLASQCAAFRYANDTEGKEDMYAYTNLTANLAHSITSFIEKWVPTKLKTSWTKLEHSELIKYFDRLKGKQLAEDVKVYQELSANLTEIMNPIGFWGYRRQFLITPALTVDSDFAVLCPPKWCIFLHGINAVNLLWTQFLLDELYRSRSARKWIHSIQPTIEDVLDENHYLPAKEIIAKIEKKIGTNLTSDEHFHSMALFRFHTNGFANCHEEPFLVKSFQHAENVFAIYNFSYFYYEPDIKDCQFFHFVFAL